MDFIVKLSKSENINTNMKYDRILVVINKLIKYIYFILCKEVFETK